ncbi:hypothetical protein PA10_00117 [Pseudomonas phage pPa_SNUABM_DT01]|nr:hypothetical protein PA10_00117 [Pseudomonas phage pPa_SNUABM_DT01]
MTPLDVAILDFKELVKVHQERTNNPNPPPLTHELKRKIGDTLDRIAEFAVGYQKDSLVGLPILETVESMRCVRRDIYERLQEEGIEYSHAVSNGTIACVLTDKETGASMHVSLSDRFDHELLHRLSWERKMEWVSLH